jgi:hypothetical protein
MAERHITKHQKRDKNEGTDEKAEKNYQRQQKHLNRQIEKISNFLENIELKKGRRGEEIKSNVTDNESALIMSSEGYIQGYIGLAVSDSENQVIISAQAAGSANECEHLPQMLRGALDNMQEAAVETPEGVKRTLLADKNYFSEENLQACADMEIEAVIPDSQYKRRLGENKEMRYEADDFIFNEEGNYYVCPQGKRLAYCGASTLSGVEGKVYQARAKDCRVCSCYSRCMRSKKGQGVIDKGRKIMITKSNRSGSLCAALRKKLNGREYQDRYAYRIQIIEPVFANITYCKGLNRFTLRGKDKVNGQWQLYCMAHNLGKCLKGYNTKKGYA